MVGRRVSYNWWGGEGVLCVAGDSLGEDTICSGGELTAKGGQKEVMLVVMLDEMVGAMRRAIFTAQQYREQLFGPNNISRALHDITLNTPLYISPFQGFFSALDPSRTGTHSTHTERESKSRREKMKTILSSETMDLPDGVKIKVKAKMIEVEGPRGKLTRDFKHLNLDFQLITDEETGKRKLKVDAWFGSRKTTAAIRTALSHVGNLINGVTKGYRYKMRFVYAHFPINASITNGNKSIEIRNFLGEKKVRKVDMLDGVTILRSEKVKDELVLDGNDIELVSRSTALINQKCHVKNKDIRKFLDGIYVSEKGTIVEEE
ncbi:60S ribosomal protein L9-1 [Abeliophyllum distichum]|uniref:60S ribosomal protein L9-1 n=1 Tax=Abeliophyllum distichum TaxID=126358 RepID=A0ABD1W0R6_9LAMI